MRTPSDDVLDQLLRYDLACLNEVDGRQCQTDDMADMDHTLPLLAEMASTGGSRMRLVGFDEAGRGAVGGPVAVGCVSFDSECYDRAEIREALAGLNDSKRVTPRNRDRLFAAIRAQASSSVAFSSALEIDRLGIAGACRLAVIRAFRRLGEGPRIGMALFDRGLALKGENDRLPCAMREITKGDSTSLHIAAASILAKVARDRLMEHLDKRFPGYELARHKGYGTSVHRQAIQELGPSPIHRRTFLTSFLNQRPDCLLGRSFPGYPG